MQLFKKKQVNAPDLADFEDEMGNEQPKKSAKNSLFSKSVGGAKVRSNEDRPAKKSLFGKASKPTDASVDKPTKKLGLGKLGAVKSADKRSATNDKAARPSRRATDRAKSQDIPMLAKLLIALAIVLGVVVVGYVAKMFLFPEPMVVTSTAPAVQAPAPAAEPAPAAAQGENEPTADSVVIAQAEDTAQGEQAIAQVSTPAQSLDPSPAPNADATSEPAQAATPVASGSIGYDEFLEQAGNRIYIERDTTPPGR